MITKMILATEVCQLSKCLEALAEHHNKVSVHHAGYYPVQPIKITLEQFKEAIITGISCIFAVETSSEIVGFCKIDIHGNKGKIDYLVVMEEYRGKGYGSLLMDWAVNFFDESNVGHVEVKIISGNVAALKLYERYGFVINAHILWRTHADN